MEFNYTNPNPEELINILTEIAVEKILDDSDKNDLIESFNLLMKNQYQAVTYSEKILLLALLKERVKIIVIFLLFLLKKLEIIVCKNMVFLVYRANII